MSHNDPLGKRLHDGALLNTILSKVKPNWLSIEPETGGKAKKTTQLLRLTRKIVEIQTKMLKL
jgi:hypothetical protein